MSPKRSTHTPRCALVCIPQGLSFLEAPGLPAAARAAALRIFHDSVRSLAKR